MVLLGNTPDDDAWAWRVPVQSAGRPFGDPRSININGRTGLFMRADDEFMNLDVTGTVRGYATPYSGHLPHIPGTNDPVLTPLPEVRVSATIIGGGAPVVYTAANGTYTVTIGGSGQAVNVNATVGPLIAAAGLYVTIVDARDDTTFPPPGLSSCVADPISALSASASVTNPASSVTLDLPYSATPATVAEYHTAQANAVIHAHRCRYYFVDRLYAEIPELEKHLRIIVNYQSYFGACGGAFLTTDCGSDGSWNIVLARSGQLLGAGLTCRNTSYSGIIAHEFGHYIHTALGFPNGTVSQSFTEGFADAYAIMVNDRREIGRAIRDDESNLRDDPTDSTINCQYPITNGSPEICRCSGLTGGSPHNAGQLLSGIWLRMIDEFRGEYGGTNGLEYARNLHVRWALVTAALPTSSCSSATCATLNEVLLADDNDANLQNGTPNDDLIYAAFDAHSISPCID